MDAVNAKISNVFDMSLDKSVKVDADLKSRQQKIKAAKDFEAVFLRKLMDEMKETVDSGGLFNDPVGGQIKGLFYSFLADDLADKGGMGMWKEIYNMMGSENEINNLLDEKI